MNFKSSLVKFAELCPARKAGAIFIATIALLFASVPAFSQGSAGRIVGTITDQTGGAISGATVSVVDSQRGTTRTLTTEDSGAYNAPNLLPGAYKVRAEFKGFKIIERQNIALEVGQEIRVDLAMQPGEQTQMITVTEEIPLVDTTNAELGGTLSNQTINDLPLNGRNFENLLVLRPGVTIYPGASGWTQSTNGMRAHDNSFMVDGINSNDPWAAQSIMNAVLAAGDAGTILSIDAIEEFKTQQNPRAEYGWKPGSIVNVGVKSGTNTFHGTAYAYGRSEAFDARNYFNVDVKGNPACVTDPIRCAKTPVELEQFGGTFGGPIKKDKLFFFANFEQQRYTVGNPAEGNSPITGPAGASNPVDGLIGACNAVRAAGQLTALSAQLAGLNFADCQPIGGQPANGFQGFFPVNDGPAPTIVTSLNTTNRISSGLMKIDYHPGSRHSFSGMYFISPGSGVAVDVPGQQVAHEWLSVLSARSQVGSGSWTWTPNSTWVNEARVGYSHYYQSFQGVDQHDDVANYAFAGSTYHIYTGQTNPAYFGLGFVTFDPYATRFGNNWPKIIGPDSVLQLLDQVSYLRGNHAFKFGGEVLLNRSTNDIPSNAKGPINFADLQSFFGGQVTNANFGIGNYLRHMGFKSYAGFFQDDWRVTPRLTVNAGVRYELNTVYTEDNNLLANFDPSKGLQQVGANIPAPFHGDHNNFAPRLGLAWDVFGNGKTVVRAGGGVMYEQLSLDVFNQTGSVGLRTNPTGARIITTQTGPAGVAGPGNINTIGTTQTAQVNANWANNGPNNPLFATAPVCGDGKQKDATGKAYPACNILGVDPNLRTPYVTTWTVGIQRAISPTLSLEVDYVGNHGTKLLGLTDLNQPQPVTLTNVGNGVGTVIVGPGYSADILKACAANPSKSNCKPSATSITNARPFTAACAGSGPCFSYLTYVDWMSNLDHSNYNALQVVLTQRPWHGLSYTAGYTFSHALDSNSDNWGNGLHVPINNALPSSSLYGNSVFDLRHRLTLSSTFVIPGRKGMGQILEGWSINSIVTLQSGQPWGIRDTSTDFSGTGELKNPASSQGEQWNFFGNTSDFTPVHGWTDTNGGGGGAPYFPHTTNATCLAKAQSVGVLAVASLTNLGCYAVGNSVLIPAAYGSFGTTGRNIFRDAGFRNWDMSVTKVFKFKERLTAQFRAEFFNVLNHPDFVNPFGGPGSGGSNGDTNPSAPGAPFGFIQQTPDVVSSNPVLGTGGARAMQLGLKIIF